jgi:hypothetical protein
VRPKDRSGVTDPPQTIFRDISAHFAKSIVKMAKRLRVAARRNVSKTVDDEPHKIQRASRLSWESR